MSDKAIISVRWATKQGKRITETEWDSFSKLGDFFDISNSELVELALRFSQHTGGTIPKAVFPESSFQSACHVHPQLSALEASLKAGVLERKLRLEALALQAEFPVQKTRICFYPPFIISIEPDYRTRINLDLREQLQLTTDKEAIIIETTYQQSKT